MLLFIFSIFRRRLRYYEKEVGYNTYESGKKLTEKDRFEIREEVKSPAQAAMSHSTFSEGRSIFASPASVPAKLAAKPRSLFGSPSANTECSRVNKLQFTTRVASYACLQEMQNL